MTEGLLVVQFGALVASGHSPREIMSWTWPEIERGARAVRMYHSDLVSSFVTGKSPAFEQAKKEGARQTEIAALAREIAALGGTPLREDEVIVAEESRKIATLAEAGFAVKTHSGDDAQPQVDLFKEFSRQRTAARKDLAAALTRSRG